MRNNSIGLPFVVDRRKVCYLKFSTHRAALCRNAAWHTFHAGEPQNSPTQFTMSQFFFEQQQQQQWRLFGDIESLLSCCIARFSVGVCQATVKRERERKRAGVRGVLGKYWLQLSNATQPSGRESVYLGAVLASSPSPPAVRHLGNPQEMAAKRPKNERSVFKSNQQRAKRNKKQLTLRVCVCVCAQHVA